MTKHELLTVLSQNGPLSISDLMKFDVVSRPAIWKAIRRLRNEGCVKIVALKGRSRIYEITSRGLSKLKYFDDYGCFNSFCSEYRKKGID